MGDPTDLQEMLRRLLESQAALQTELNDLRAAQNITTAPPATTTIMNTTISIEDLKTILKPAGSKSHAKDLSSLSDFTGEDPKQLIEDFLADAEAAFDQHHTPDSDKVSLLVTKLQGTARKRFKGFVNTNGDLGNRKTTSYTEFVDWALVALAHDKKVEAKSLRARLEALRQTGSCQTFVNAFSALQARIWANPEAKKNFTMDGMINTFIEKTKVQVQERLLSKEYNTLETVYRDAINIDNLLFSLSSSIKRNPVRESPARSTPLNRNPGPPPHIVALLNSMGFNPDGTLVPPGNPAARISLNAVDHSVRAGDPIPKMTPEIEAWCKANHACFRCREKNAKHVATNCPKFAGKPQRTRINNVQEEQHAGQEIEEAEQGNGP
jgi:hypothetical protein